MQVQPATIQGCRHGQEGKAGTKMRSNLPELLTVPAHIEEAPHDFARIVQICERFKQRGNTLGHPPRPRPRTAMAVLQGRCFGAQHTLALHMPADHTSMLLKCESAIWAA